ncbi:hypothetical protein A2X44_00910 [candidate division CPR3 bacterium GWF2_35_18]|uniref:Glycosyl transferase, group 2 family protein n=1 Tax=candidate division CPR3 bacterium GW2011_GWF2_35_18 TaxID=1618350 RepID=A0A0G0ESE9_UNCC3|nr:MAG: Glycosyl transferase, group 2 family protein [candidate division CPR3 bacterium GW2011_GWF2_35_18]KKP86147.1 MAG: Glycosyl transferase, group 2 family protein [candidate division CPR3 bacterium GW2011_GWE2_35_7]OGB63465.1 MAG: hypothetical protein A2X44_00910 [candidate division CPR3 bacterium GWF2_35_18]OGB64789.1 MAG: hypothetical protein A2250_05115 [candidate division CPR3 bacterium RIFOXYA2_FULL_35_13]OGB78583.1 MAG: hypothetical protein A2296_01515 [candidate division CPR3 bacteri
MPRTLVVIPTYNEKDNLPLILKEIDDLKVKNLTVLVVDDNSPDGTGSLADNLRSKFLNLFVLHRRKKEGLGKAYIDGFKYALKKFDFNYLLQMDADFSHDPQDIKRIIKTLSDYDVVIGSRHIEGAELRYPLFRKALSSCANLYARTIFLLPVHDCTSGFKGYRREVIEEIIQERYYSNAYAFQNEILFYIKRHGFTIKEIPVVFEDRVRGKSKMNAYNIFDGFWGMLKLRFREFK